VPGSLARAGHDGCRTSPEHSVRGSVRITPHEDIIMVRTLARLALVGIAGGVLWSLRRQLGLEGGDSSRASKHPAEQTWEGEGGALPSTGSQLGPDPVLPVATETAF
jgi:hypothetical protein